MKLILSLFITSFLLTDSHDFALEDQITGEIETYVRDYYDGVNIEAEAELKWLPNSVSEEASVEITGIELSGSGNPRGYESFKLSYRNGREGKETRVQAYIRVYKEVPVATTQIRSGEELDEDNISLRRKDVSQFNRTPAQITSFDNLVAASTLREGTILTERHIKQPPVIESGESASMMIKNAGLLIQLNVTARQSGAEGETIRVQSDKTRETYEVEIIDPNNVKWKRTL